jgi:hypothetical protein
MSAAKGQMYYLEFMGAMAVFLIALSFFISQVLGSINQSGGSIVSLEARAVADSLMSEGIPEKWSSSDVKKIGLTDGDSKIDESKLLMFANMSYSSAKKLFNVKSDYYFYLENSKGAKLNIAGKTALGIEPAGAKKISKYIRLAVYKSEIVQMVVLAWQKT